MITRKGVITLLAQSHHRFFYSCRTLDRRQAGFSILNVNLKLEHKSFVQSVNSRWMSVTSLVLPENDIKKFLNHLIKAYTDGTSTNFDYLLKYRPIILLMKERLQIIENIRNLEELEEDKEMKQLAKEEMCVNENQLKQIDNKLMDLILENFTLKTYDDVIMEISAGVGGQEAMLFAKDLLEMYKGHFTYLGYDFEIIELNNAAQGGIRNSSIMISGDRAFEKLRHEAGNHRVQRVPTTEKSGRIHTSVVSVAVLPQPSEIEINIMPRDLKIDTMRATGAGGQHVNTTDSAVRITHLPTGIIVECQTQRSQFKNKETALAKLKTKLYQIELDKQMKSSSSMRRQQMGLGQRNEKIRTYNFNQDRVTDHRIPDGTLHNLERFLEGGQALDGLHFKLNEDLHRKVLLEAVTSV